MPYARQKGIIAGSGPMTCIDIRLVVVAATMIASVCVAPAQEAGSTPASAGDPSPFGILGRVFNGSERFLPGAPVQNPAADPNRVAQGPNSELIVRLDRLETQIRQLTGVIEQLQYRNQQL